MIKPSSDFPQMFSVIFGYLWKSSKIWENVWKDYHGLQTIFEESSDLDK